MNVAYWDLILSLGSWLKCRATEIADLGRGLEMAAHKEFSIATDVQVYFCDP